MTVGNVSDPTSLFPHPPPLNSITPSLSPSRTSLSPPFTVPHRTPAPPRPPETSALYSWPRPGTPHPFPHRNSNHANATQPRANPNLASFQPCKQRVRLSRRRGSRKSTVLKRRCPSATAAAIPHPELPGSPLHASPADDPAIFPPLSHRRRNYPPTPRQIRKGDLRKIRRRAEKITKLSPFTPPPTSTCISSRGIPAA